MAGREVTILALAGDRGQSSFGSIDRTTQFWLVNRERHPSTSLEASRYSSALPRLREG